MNCPRCNGEMWDNRIGGPNPKKNPKAPDYKCMDKDCKWKLTKNGWEPSDFPTSVWLENAPQASQNAPQSTKPPRPEANGQRRGMATNCAVQLVASGKVPYPTNADELAKLIAFIEMASIKADDYMPPEL